LNGPVTSFTGGSNDRFPPTEEKNAQAESLCY